MDLNLLNENLETFERELIRKESIKNKLEEQLEGLEEKNKDIINRVEVLEAVKLLLQKTSDFAREQAKLQIEELVTNCIQYIFDNDSRFSIELHELYKRTNAEFYLVDDVEGVETKTIPTDSRGGGIVDIISIALRISFLELYKPRISGPLILDEPAKHVSDEYIFNLSNFLLKASDMFNRQIIMVTHNPHLAALSMNTYKVYKEESVSIVEKSES